MKWLLLLALILVLAVLAFFFFGRSARKDAMAAPPADKDHQAAEAPAEKATAEEPVETPAAEPAADEVTEADTAAVVAEAESVTAAAVEEPAAEEAEPAPVAAEPETAPAAETPAGTDGAPYAGAVLPAGDGTSSDAAYTIKGSSGKKYHTTASPYYGRTKAAVYFDSEESAESAGFVIGFKKKTNA